MKLWLHNLLRFAYRPLLAFLRLRVRGDFYRHPELGVPQPWDYVQLLAERRLHEYLGCPSEEIRLIVIVGAYDGAGVKRMKNAYPQCTFHCFEPSPANFARLLANYQDCPDVKCSQMALGAEVGEAQFFEPKMTGTGSLLSPDDAVWATMNQLETDPYDSYHVQVSTLDEEFRTNAAVDLLWVDVQGAEKLVLEGGKLLLDRVRAIFLEVALERSPYQCGVLFEELTSILNARDFHCCGLGLDPNNLTGNSLWTRSRTETVSPQGTAGNGQHGESF